MTSVRSTAADGFATPFRRLHPLQERDEQMLIFGLIVVALVVLGYFWRRGRATP